LIGSETASQITQTIIQVSQDAEIIKVKGKITVVPLPLRLFLGKFITISIYLEISYLKENPFSFSFQFVSFK
jgi:hypothetical protein